MSTIRQAIAAITKRIVSTNRTVRYSWTILTDLRSRLVFGMTGHGQTVSPQVLRWYRRRAVVGVHLVNDGRKLDQGSIHHGLDAPDGMRWWDRNIRRNRLQRDGLSPHLTVHEDRSLLADGSC